MLWDAINELLKVYCKFVNLFSQLTVITEFRRWCSFLKFETIQYNLNVTTFNIRIFLF